MTTVLAFVWQITRGVLPYPDLLRRWRLRHKARGLVTCKKWPGDDATGADAAQLALLRLLWLQRLVRRAVRARRSEDAALLARASLETCIVGLYCLHSEDAVGRLSAANYRAAGRVVSYLSDIDLVSKTAIDSAVQALGELGPDLNVKDIALWLAEEKKIVVVRGLYKAYYVPLSHFFIHANAFTLMRHVHQDGTLHRRPEFPWARRSAVRMSDGCTGLLAANIADKSGIPSEPFTRYAAAHLDRTLTPALMMTLKGASQSVPWHKIPGIFKALIATRRYVRSSGRADDPAQQESRVREGFAKIFESLITDPPEGMFTQPLNEYVAKVLAEMNHPADETVGNDEGTT